MLLKKQKSHYQKLAWIVIRDAVGFYFGIQEFFDANNNLTEAVDFLVKQGKTKDEARKIVLSRMKELTEDFEHCKEILSTDNIWHQLLDQDPEVFFQYLNTLSTDERRELAVVPRWTTRDYFLGRPYLNDKFGINAGTNSST
jgi:hypothetical protein